MPSKPRRISQKLVEQEGRLQLAISAIEKNEIPSIHRAADIFNTSPSRASSHLTGSCLDLHILESLSAPMDHPSDSFSYSPQRLVDVDITCTILGSLKIVLVVSRLQVYGVPFTLMVIRVLVKPWSSLIKTDVT
jgi:hypothetical protein